jgi:FAD/FMN-containing dehydrogenase
VRSNTSTSFRFEKPTLRSLANRVRGDVLRPGDDGYDETRRVWNAMIDREPAVIARCTGAADVIAAVDFARERDLLLSIRGGGHNVSGAAVYDDGLMIDCSPMDSVRVDPDAKTARAGPGATWGDFDHETGAFGLATTGGGVSTTGIAGLTLGGGNGFLARKYGLTVDNLRSVDLVTAEGELVHASESENPDLFWGVRGGGGNFGVVTSFEYDCHEVGSEVLGGRIVHPFDDARAVLRSYRAFVTDAPEAVNCLAGIATAPANSALPESIRGERTVQLTVCYAGAIEEGRAVLRPLRSVGEPIADLVRPQPYTRVQRILTEAAAEGYRNYWKSDYLAGLPDEAIDVVLEYCERFPSPSSSVFFETMGGAINRADAAATAFPHRNAAFSVTAWARWTDSTTDDEHVEWAREFLDAMTSYSTDGVYVNFLGREGMERVEAAYGDNYDRLAALKTEWDPGNLFRMNQNIEPLE